MSEINLGVPKLKAGVPAVCLKEVHKWLTDERVADITVALFGGHLSVENEQRVEVDCATALYLQDEREFFSLEDAKDSASVGALAGGGVVAMGVSCRIHKWLKSKRETDDDNDNNAEKVVECSRASFDDASLYEQSSLEKVSDLEVSDLEVSDLEVSDLEVSDLEGGGAAGGVAVGTLLISNPIGQIVLVGLAVGLLAGLGIWAVIKAVKEKKARRRVGEHQDKITREAEKRFRNEFRVRVLSLLRTYLRSSSPLQHVLRNCWPLNPYLLSAEFGGRRVYDHCSLVLESSASDSCPVLKVGGRSVATQRLFAKPSGFLNVVQRSIEGIILSAVHTQGAGQLEGLLREFINEDLRELRRRTAITFVSLNQDEMMACQEIYEAL